MLRACRGGPRPTPLQPYTWEPLGKGATFKKASLSDSGCTKTTVAADLMRKHGIPVDPNYLGERLEAANGAPMHVSGTVTLSGTFDPTGKSVYMDCLVTEQLSNEIIVSWYDAEAVGALTLVRRIVHTNPVPEDLSRSPSEIKAEIQKWLATFSCLSDSLPPVPMKGPPMEIKLVEGDIRPRKARTPVRVPLHYRPFSDELIDKAIEDGIIRPVERSSVSKFCARAFIVPKPSGGYRLVVDHSEVNKYIERPTHPFVAGNELIRRIPHTARCFAKLDALSGFHQIELHPDSRHITTFLHERGTFEYLRAPMGTNCSGDEWCRRSDDAVADLEGVLKLVDDILVYAENYDLLFERVKAVLQRCTDHGITLSRKKLEVGPKVTFAGFDISAAGVTPTSERTDAITKFPTPKSATGVRSFLGLGQQVAHFVPDYTAASGPLRELTKKSVPFTWGPDQAKAFEQCKSILTGDLVLRPFNPLLPTELITDASRSGLGFLLMQQDPVDKERHLVQCGSRALSPAETRYAVCELEALGCLFAVQKCRHYLLGMKTFELVTDHRSLRGVFQKELCDVENVRLRRYREKLQEYTFTVSWRPGKSNLMADALSRNPVSPPGEPEEVAGPCVCRAIRSGSGEGDPALAPLLAAAAADPAYQQLVQAVLTTINPSNLNPLLAPGLPADHPARAFDKVWKELSVHPTGLVVFRNDRIVVPVAHQQQILKTLHIAHCGMQKTRWAMSRDFYWPSFNKDVERTVSACDQCRRLLPSLPQETVRQMNDATAPMELVGSDLFEIGKHHYIVAVDQYSGYILAARLPSTTAAAVISTLRSWFNLLGRPEGLLSDGGPQYTSSEMQRFLAAHGIRHYKSSVAYPQGNGLSESAVKKAKHLLMKVREDMEAFEDALLESNNMPTAADISPAEMFFARRQRTSIPTLPGKTGLNVAHAVEGAQSRQETLTMEYAKIASGDLPQLNLGQKVSVQNIRGNRKGKWDETGVIVEAMPNGRDYVVQKDLGGRPTLNRRYLRALADVESPTAPLDPDGGTAAAPSGTDVENSAEVNPERELHHPDTAPPPRPQLAAARQSNRARRPTSCQSCVGCSSIKCLTCSSAF